MHKSTAQLYSVTYPSQLKEEKKHIEFHIVLPFRF